MIKELRYLFFLIVIFLFFLFSFKYYFSDSNKKKSYRSFQKINEKVIRYSENLIFLKNDTNNIIQYISKGENKNKKVFNFWKLINNDK
jgi:hypothetical protein